MIESSVKVVCLENEPCVEMYFIIFVFNLFGEFNKTGHFENDVNLSKDFVFSWMVLS